MYVTYLTLPSPNNTINMSTIYSMKLFSTNLPIMVFLLHSFLHQYFFLLNLVVKFHPQTEPIWPYLLNGHYCFKVTKYWIKPYFSLREISWPHSCVTAWVWFMHEYYSRHFLSLHVKIMVFSSFWFYTFIHWS